MEKLEHDLWIVQAANAAFGPMARALLRALGRPAGPGNVIPDYLVMAAVIVLFWTVICLIVRRSLSVDNPGKLQVLIEDGVAAARGVLHDYVGHKGPRYLAIVATMFVFILTGNLMGLVPGLKSPTANINVTLGCALTVSVYYHLQGVKEQGIGPYLKHFAAPPGAPIFLAPIMLPIEIISHLSRVLSLSLRLFGNIFGEDLVILILFSIIPFLVPLPMMFLGLVTASLQAFIFVLLTTIYLGGAVATEHEHHEHGEMIAGEV
ncbi:MAG: ATP synthase F0 subunit A [Acidobacteria bacterium]|nr:MAG: ATP synthase F0 subunit A [Acidobacteriota bacterium]PYQ79178.1 MAG: ATP synthase F0 subunit A [Acidobacteriota bacterium]PYQ88357.1 MAG: ATP synthase F0 subunit A [Acidobacteriota bacterium]PYR08471.1 MAG: ATP synthase F0 subunit A [Acidobacteriota bacterium]